MSLEINKSCHLRGDGIRWLVFFSGNFAYAPPDVRVGLGTPTALGGHIVGLIEALKPRYVPGIHGPKGGGLHYLITIEHFFIPCE